MIFTNSKRKDLDMESELCEQCGKPELSCTCYNETLVPELSEGMKFDNGKLLYSLIPPETLKALAEVLTYGAQKYAPNNWIKVENGDIRYMDALFRHLEAFRSGETHDPESGYHHLSHCLCNIMFLHYLSTKA